MRSFITSMRFLCIFLQFSATLKIINRIGVLWMFDEFVAQIDEKWHGAYIKLMETIDENLPPGFEKSIDRNMIVYNVPLTTYRSEEHTSELQSRENLVC